MIAAAFLLCALALPSTTQRAPMRSMDAPVWGRIQMVQMMQSFTSEFVDENQQRVLVAGELWKMVVSMRRNGIKAFGIWNRPTRNRYTVRGLEYLMPFKDTAFSIVINDSRMERISDLLVLRLNEMARVLAPGGFIFTPSDEGDQPEAILFGLGFSRLGFTFERLAVFQKHGDPRIYWGAQEMRKSA